jgi:beta-lactamase regulating signal transducer with metallopeptidase domain
MIMKPAAEWDVVAAEPATIGSIYTGYAVILAAIPAIATLIGSILFAHANPIAAVVTAVLGYVLALVGLYITSFIVDALAPSFGGEKNQVQALKLVTYANTAAWVAGVLNIVPILGALGALVGGIYSLYVLYLGLPKLMKNPADKTLVYFIVTLVVAVVVYAVIGLVVGIVIGMLALGAMATTGAIH